MSVLLDESLFGEAIRNASLGAWLSREASVLAVNRACAEMTGYTRTELISGLVGSLAADDATRRQEEEVRAGRRVHGIAKLLRKDAHVIEVGYLVTSTRVARDTLTLGLIWQTA